jgi:hypothetical protein
VAAALILEVKIMGQNEGDKQVANPADKQEQAKGKEGGVALSQYVMTEAERAAGNRTTAANDANMAAPTGAGQRMWDVTKEGVTKIPDGFMNSLDPHNILPNVGMGFAIGAATKLILPEAGPVAKVAGTALAAYFFGKPVYDTYKGAYFAETMGDMHHASDILGNAIGGLPVGMAEGAAGGYLGSKAMGMVLSTRAAAPFVDWKANQYNKLDVKLDNGMANMRNFGYDHLGIGSPVLKAESVTGVVPPHLLEELAKRNPDNLSYADTIKKMNAVRDNRNTPNPATNNAAGGLEGKAPREVYDAGGQEVTPGKLVRSEGQAKTGQTEVDNVYDYTGDVRSFYKDVHGRNSIDGKGMPLKSTTNYGDNFENAFWNGEQMTYGRPGANSPFKTFVLRDVTGHEMTHGVTEFEAGTVYRNQAGALNEHFSDVWGELVEQKALGQTADKGTWLVGDDIWKGNVKGKALRDMQNPGTAYDDPMLGKDPQPAHMKDFVNTRRDNGGVHINSGIPNKAFAEFAKAIGGNAWETPADVWFKARAASGSNPTFATFAFQTMEAAKGLGKPDVVTKLSSAWEAVGVKPVAHEVPVNPTFVPIINEDSSKK